MSGQTSAFYVWAINLVSLHNSAVNIGDLIVPLWLHKFSQRVNQLAELETTCECVCYHDSVAGNSQTSNLDEP